MTSRRPRVNTAPAIAAMTLSTFAQVLRLLGIWTIAGFLVLIAHGPAHAQADAVDSSALKGRVIEREDLPADELGHPIVDGLPGFLPAREVPQGMRDEMVPLEEERDRVLDSARAARAIKEVSRLPSDAGAPPAMDGGNPDPDRLLPTSQPPKPSFQEF